MVNCDIHSLASLRLRIAEYQDTFSPGCSLEARLHHLKIGVCPLGSPSDQASAVDVETGTDFLFGIGIGMSHSRGPSTMIRPALWHRIDLFALETTRSRSTPPGGGEDGQLGYSWVVASSRSSSILVEKKDGNIESGWP